MNSKIYTGQYSECKAGNLISISGDRGKSIGYSGKAFPLLAPKREFWKIWHDNIGKIPEEENTRFYIEQYYNQVLKKTDLEALLSNEENPILLCYERSNEFCHRHIVAEYIELKYGIYVPEISIDNNMQIIIKERPKVINQILGEIIDEKIGF